MERLISYSHHTNDFRQYCHVGDTAQHCRLGLFQDSDFAGDLEDSKKTSVSHGSTESEIISLDAGLRIDGLPALDLWHMVIEMLRSTNNNAQFSQTSHQETGAILDSKTKTQHVKRKQKDEQLSEVDYVPTKTHSSQGESQLYIFEDNEACPDVWTRLPRHKWPKSWVSIQDAVYPLERNLCGHPLARLLCERQFEEA